MPYSASVFDNIARQILRLCDPDTVLEIGPGEGKYGRMLLDIEARRGRPIRKTCVEVDNEQVIQRFGLASIYDEVINEDAARLIRKYPSLTGDIVIAADVIEHLTKSEGVDLIEFLQYRFKHIFLIIPIDWVCLEYEDYSREAHVSIWPPEDIGRFNGGYCIERLMDDGHKFLLAVINSIAIPASEYFVIRNAADAAPPPLYYEAGIEFGYLNR
jgi:phospholipid N-methyltransferase